MSYEFLKEEFSETRFDLLMGTDERVEMLQKLLSDTWGNRTKREGRKFFIRLLILLLRDELGIALRETEEAKDESSAVLILDRMKVVDHL